MKEYWEEQMTDALANSFLGEKVSFETLNAITGKVIIPANRKITKTLLRKLVGMRDELAPPSSPIHDCIRESIVRFGRSAVSWFRKAAEQGHADAQRNLALCYQNGDGIEVDLVQAFAWLQLAADQAVGNPSVNPTGWVQEQADAVAALLSHELLGNARGLYLDYKRKYPTKQ